MRGTTLAFNVIYIGSNSGGRTSLLQYLEKTAATIEVHTHLPDQINGVVVIAAPEMLDGDEWLKLQQHVQAGGSCLIFAGQMRSLPDWIGIQPAGDAINSELRVLFTERNNPLGRRLPDAFYVHSAHQPLDVQADNVETLLYADWRYTHQPVLLQRPYGSGCIALTTLSVSGSTTQLRIFYRLLRRLAGQSQPQRSLGIGLLGYAPSVGQLHGMGAAETAGLHLQMACDLSPARLQAAREAFPAVAVTTDSAEMRDSNEVDIVIIATPPNSHAKLAIEMLSAGKHVICEKPLALTTDEATRMIAAARDNDVYLGCHQNRRWDSDYLAVRRALDDELIGNPFYMELFIGGYGHPCGYWHSEESVSGGTTFDWGAHYLDWMLDLMPQRVTEVIATRQNRVWHDITNADQERIQLRFAGGEEAEFMHSDLAFVPKPKWYLLGDQGAIVGRWQQATAYQIDDVYYYEAHDIPPSELGADLTARVRDRRGQIYERQLPQPNRERHGFHRNLADHLLLGEPVAVPVEHSARVVAVLEAAKRSAENGGRIEQVNI